MTDHTPVPWEINKVGCSHAGGIRKFTSAVGEAPHYEASIIEKGDPPFKVVCRLDFGYGKPEDEANAELIVRACNAHDELLEIATEAVTTLLAWQIDWGAVANDPKYQPMFSSATLNLYERLIKSKEK